MQEWNRGKFLSFLEAKDTGLIFFYTPLCGTCQVASKMLRVIREMANSKMGMMNVNFYPDLSKEFAIESVPCLLFIQEGKVVEKIYAFQSVPYLIEEVNKNLS